MTEPGRCLSILIVDDDADMRAYVRACLQSLAPRLVTEASDGNEALELFASAPPDLIIADVFATGPDGSGLFGAGSDAARLSAVPILVVSGQTDGAPGLANAVLRKPFNAAVLQATVVGMFG